MRRLLCVSAVAAAILLVACDRLGLGFTKIGELLAKPQQFAGQEVRISGTASHPIKLPFVSLRIYSVRDATGEILVRCEGEPPPDGTTVRVKGVLETVAVIGDQNV